MIKYSEGNLLDAEAEALVNTVNEVGVMGKGIALQFRDAFPDSAREYEAAAKAGKVRVGCVMVTHNTSLLGPRLIIHFPTKKHWRQPSQLSWVRDGLKDLARVIRLENIRSIALPPLGCGNGGLDWIHVKRIIEAGLGELADVEVTVFKPTTRYHNAPKRAGIEALTPARVLIAEIIRRYGVLGIECSVLEVQKLAWILTRAIIRARLDDPLSLKFVPNKYGPYADNLRFLLDHLDGSYLHCEKRLADAKPLDAIWFEQDKRDAVSTYLKSADAKPFLPALEDASAVIAGFESPLGLELLATVDWLIYERRVAPDVASVREALAEWPAGRSAARRKHKLLDERLVSLALDRLNATLLSVS